MGTMTIAFVLALAPLAGYLLGRFAKEELAPGRKWFALLQDALFVAVIFVFAYAHKLLFVHAGIGLAVIFAYLAFKQYRIWWVIQALLGITYALTANTPQAFLLSSLVFLRGLPTGSLAKKPKDALLAGAVFFVIAAGLSLFL
jgi:hypothetical protein